MNRNMWKTTLREIRSSLGRYLAIFAITALGVGFFSGLKVSREAFVDAGNSFTEKTGMFDFRLVSTLGLTDGDVEAAEELAVVGHAYGAFQADAIVTDGNRDYTVRFHSLDENVNKADIKYGRLPQKAGEAVVDGRYYSGSDIGKHIVISDENSKETLDAFETKEYEIVGVAFSPLYLNYERGTTSVGNGSIACFFLVPGDCFSSEVYTDIYLTLKDDYYLYSEEYSERIDLEKNNLEVFLKERADKRYDGLYADAKTELDNAKAELQDAEDKLQKGREDIENGKREIADKLKEIEDGEELVEQKEIELAAAAFLLPEENLAAAKEELGAYKEKLAKGREAVEAASKEIENAEKELNEKTAEYEEAKGKLEEGEEELAGFKRPSTFVLTRNENVGYVCFENDSKIVDGIAVVFPVFFFLVAALVCITTMSRMIEEQRTQIGVLKALGYGDASIMAKYMIYSGSAAVTGCVAGFFLGCKAFPAIIWKVYGLMYGFTEVRFVFNVWLFIISLAVSLLCSVGTTWFSCKKDLRKKAAELIRPKAPGNGRRIFLEKLTFIWKRLSFLRKVSIRNVFRYKGRFVMMLLGIGGCAGLLVTGYGIRDSITGIADEQYTKILVYDELINFTEEKNEEELKLFSSRHEKYIEDYLPVFTTSVDPVDTGAFRAATLTVLQKEEGWRNVLHLHDGEGRELAYPAKGEVILTSNVASINNVEVGDTIIFRDSDYNEFKLRISGVCENFFNSYAYIDATTYEEVTGRNVPYKSAFVGVSEGMDLHEASAEFMNDGDVRSVSVNADTREMFTKMMQTMNYIVVLVIVCAAALAFIVLYNLTNINITERIREIATIKVLGFYSGETAAYVFRENMALTVIGALFGLPIGIALHRYVMSNIKIEMVTFDVKVNGITFVYAVLYTIIFALFVDFVMYFRLAKINMAESLKSIE